MDLMSSIQRLLQPLRVKIATLIGRATIDEVNDQTTIQTVKIEALESEVLEGVPRVQEFGFTSRPPAGTDAIVVAVGGSRESLVVIATDHKQFRFKLGQDGESALYTSDGTVIHLKMGGEIEIQTATKITIDAPDVEITGKLKVVGATQLNSTLEVTGTSDLKSAVTVTGPLTASGAIVGATLAGGGVTATGGGDVSGGGTTLSSLKAKYNAHKHGETGTTTTVGDAPA